MKILNDISEIHIGYNFRSEATTERQTVFVISAKNLADFTNADKIVIPWQFNNYLRAGDILVKSRGANYEARVFQPCNQEYPYVASNTLIVVRLTTDAYGPAYIAQVINSEKAQRFLRSLSSGATLPALSPSSLGCLPCPEASLEEQMRLENIAETMDDYRMCLAQYQKAGENLVKIIEQQLMKGTK